MHSSCKSLSLRFALSALFLMASSPTTFARTVPLSELLGGGELIWGDKKFDQFEYLATGDMPPAHMVNVEEITDGDGNLGIRFQGGFIDTALSDGASDALIGFRVSVLDDDFAIIGAHLRANPAVIGGPGVASVVESFSGLPNMLQVYDIVPGQHRHHDWTTFQHPLRELHVRKDIEALAFFGTAGVISYIDQTFEQVQMPEPSSLSLLGVSLLGLGAIRRRRAK